MNIQTTLNTLCNNAIANYKAYRAASAEYFKNDGKVEFKTPDYAVTSAEFEVGKVSASFSATGRANCRRSLHTEGTVRWTLNGKKIALATLIATLNEVAA